MQAIYPVTLPHPISSVAFTLIQPGADMSLVCALLEQRLPGLSLGQMGWATLPRCLLC